jgi:hypothetical protein
MSDVKKVDAVKMMRDIRDVLAGKYLNDPDSEETDMRMIRKRHQLLVKEDHRHSLKKTA